LGKKVGAMVSVSGTSLRSGSMSPIPLRYLAIDETPSV
jgi:hypothetical protein